MNLNNLIHQALVYDEVLRQNEINGRAAVTEVVGSFPNVTYLGAWLCEGPDGKSCFLRVWYDGDRISTQIHQYHSAVDIFSETLTKPHAM